MLKKSSYERYSQFYLLINIVLESYEIENYTHCEVPSGGILNRVYILCTTQGKYVLKDHLYRNTTSKLQPLKSLLNHLKSRDFSCDYIIPTKDRKFCFEFQSSVYTLHRYIDGTNYANLSQLNMMQLTNAMKFLVEYHRVVGGFSVEGVGIKPSILPVVFTDDVQWTRDYISDHQSVFQREGDYQFVMSQIDELEEYVTGNCYQDLPRLLIHGDYRFCNLVFRNNQVNGLFDWDLLQYAPRVFEVVDACSNFAAENSIGEADFNHLFLTYQREACKNKIALSAQEIAAIPAMLKMKALQTGVNFAILLRELPLKPNETYDQRIKRSYCCLNDALEILRNIDHGNALLPSMSSIRVLRSINC